VYRPRLRSLSETAGGADLADTVFAVQAGNPIITIS